MNKTGIDPYNNNKKLDPFGYNLMKYNCVIMRDNAKRNFKTYQPLFK